MVRMMARGALALLACQLAAGQMKFGKEEDDPKVGGAPARPSTDS
eukprot:SAG22_NODE_460_length_10218_cov_5.663109_10_plen_45_part_00